MSIFDKQVNRRGTGSYKWDDIEEEGVIPLWVADMDFEAAPAIREALARRIEHGVFGYTEVDEAYFEAIISNHALKTMNVGENDEVFAYIKSTSIHISTQK